VGRLVVQHRPLEDTRRAAVHRQVLIASPELAAEEIERPAAFAVMRLQASGDAVAQVAEFLQLGRHPLVVHAEERQRSAHRPRAARVTLQAGLVALGRRHGLREGHQAADVAAAPPVACFEAGP
jgi:hypothetical protein